MAIDAFDSPEQAAIAAFPAEHGRAVACCTGGDDAYVLLDTGLNGQRYLHGVHCGRVEAGWRERGSSNGPGWSQAGPSPRLGTLVAWGIVNRDADSVRVTFGHERLDVPVRHGVYLCAWWRVSAPADADQPRIEAVRVNGTWRFAAESGGRP